VKFAVSLVSFLLLAAMSVFGLGEHGTLVRVANMYVSPDEKSAKLAEIGRGYDLVVIENSRDWAHIQAILGEEKMLTGWILDKGLVRASTPDGDKIVYGAAADAEDEASRRHGRKGADQDALRLYYRVFDLFPNSSYAGEGLYRAADIRWQVERIDVMSRGSAKEQSPYMREGMNEEWMRQVIKKFPGTRWADLAAFRLLENKVCGDWQGSTKCPEKESAMYEKYTDEHPRSPAAAQSLYQAAWRQAVMVDMFKTDENQKKADEARGRALAITQRLVKDYPESDWSVRAQTLMFLVQGEVPIYGNAIE
jgi:outer membrane protein assembly factor BamD (BamD/ComL family)